jgi:nitronate monooxygenase
VASGIFDTIWGRDWPGVQARALRNHLTDRWLGRETELGPVREVALLTLERAEGADDPDEIFHLAGMGVGRIHDLVPAGQVVTDVIAEAEDILREWGSRLPAAVGART